MPELGDYRNCQLCPRHCGVDREAGKTGVCGETAVCRVAHAGSHFGEEPAFSGTRGSGTVFFSGCSCRCFFCQNHQISLNHLGDPADADRLHQLARRLIGEGVHNLNFVTPDHFWPHIRELCQTLRAEGETLPFLYNCSGYQLPELVPAVAEVVDIFLPDFKFAVPELAKECIGAADYPDVALAALRRMVAAHGFLEPWDPTGEMPAQRGVLVRHLVLPGQVENSLRTLRLLHAEFGSQLPLSVMSQYRPMPNCQGHGGFTRPVRAAEYREVTDLVEELGFENVYVQELSATAEFVPDFTEDQPFAGNR